MELNVSIGECLNDFICGMISSAIIVSTIAIFAGSLLTKIRKKRKKTRVV
ncbi:MAG: hypothetical protein K5685_13960 [Bacteroidales bacterium]|nr:hypothetical protein [Bacteroidales bacterium]